MLDVIKAILLWTFIVAFIVLAYGFIERELNDNACTVTIKDRNGVLHEIVGRAD